MLALLAVVLAQQAPMSWAEIDKLVNEQKLEAAAQAVDARLQAAKKGADDAELARALLKRTQLRIGLHGRGGAGVALVRPRVVEHDVELADRAEPPRHRAGGPAAGSSSSCRAATSSVGRPSRTCW